jgi:putative spermidine/putrescine transport system substrate-binding protein
MGKKIKEMERRSFLKYSAIFSAGAALGKDFLSAPPAKAAVQEVFTIALQGGSWGDGEKKVFVEDSGFRAKHNLDVGYDVGDDGRLLAKALANCGNPIFDTHLCFSANAAKHYASGCAVDLNLDWVPNWKDLHPQARYGKYSPAFCFLAFGLVYNKKEVSPPPTSYDDLWNPKYKGRVGIPQYAWIGMYWLHAVNKYFKGNEDNVTPGINALADLMKKQKVILLDNVEHTKRLFHQGELVLAPFWDGRTIEMKQEGLPVEITFNKDMMTIGFGSVCMKGVKNPKLVHEFINVTCDPGRQLEMMKMFKYAPTNTKCKIPPEYQTMFPKEKDLENAAQIDWIKVIKHIDENMELWNKKVLGA